MPRVATTLVAVRASILAAAVAALVALVPSTVHAGGWAIAPLDPLPAVQPGAPLTVGFTVLQHGQTPVLEQDWKGFSIGVGVLVDGERRFVAAEPTGAAGHYTATIDIPDGLESLRLRVEMLNGPYIDEAWTTLPVGAGGGTTGWLPTWTVPLFGLGAVAGAVALAGSVRRRPVPAPA